MLLSPDLEAGRWARVISDELHLPLGVLQQAMGQIADPNETFPEAIALRQVLDGPHRYAPAPYGQTYATADVFLISQPEVVKTRRPKMIPLCVPLPCIKLEGEAQVSTAGIFCRDSSGNLGVTGCFHGTGPVGTDVMVDLRQCQVTRANQVQDIVFIPLGEGLNIPDLEGVGGVRIDREPARAEHVHFDGVVNQNQRTRVFGCDNGLLRARPTVQLKVQTDPDTDCGDSGCALLDENDQVIGFAFERTDYDDYPQFTDWIWAANALSALELTPLK
jgi:hypothetical protein